MHVSAFVLASTVLFTGIIGFVPSVKDKHLIRVVAPNGRIPDGVLKIRRVPGHVAYIVFDMADLQPGGRRPNFAVEDKDGRQFGVVWIESEFLKLSGNFVAKPIEYQLDTSNVTGTAPSGNNGSSLRWLFDFRGVGNPPLLFDLNLLKQKPDPAKVTLRMDLPYGTFAVEPTSVDPQFAFTVNENKNCQALARAVSLTFDPKPNEDKNILTIESTSLDGRTAPPALKLARKITNGELRIAIGNEPISDALDATDLLTGTVATMDHYGTGPQEHLLFVNRLVTGGNVFVPARVSSDQCTGTANPPVGGKSGGCSPFLLTVGDPPTK